MTPDLRDQLLSDPRRDAGDVQPVGDRRGEDESHEGREERGAPTQRGRVLDRDLGEERVGNDLDHREDHDRDHERGAVDRYIVEHERGDDEAHRIGEQPDAAGDEQPNHTPSVRERTAGVCHLVRSRMADVILVVPREGARTGEKDETQAVEHQNPARSPMDGRMKRKPWNCG